MRQKPGNIIEIFNGTDDSVTAEIRAISKKTAELYVIAPCRSFSRAPDIWFLFAPVKRTRLDFMAQKATELGARLIQPIDTDFCQVSRVKTDRLMANAIEAAEQTGRLDIPEIRSFEPLQTILGQWPVERALIFCDEKLAIHPSPPDMLAQFALARNRPAALVIGPEGGFSEKERALILECPEVIHVHLGPRILRSDTAALASLSLYQATAGDWQRQMNKT